MISDPVARFLGISFAFCGSISFCYWIGKKIVHLIKSPRTRLIEQIALQKTEDKKSNRYVDGIVGERDKLWKQCLELVKKHDEMIIRLNIAADKIEKEQSQIRQDQDKIRQGQDKIRRDQVKNRKDQEKIEQAQNRIEKGLDKLGTEIVSLKSRTNQFFLALNEKRFLRDHEN